LADANGTEKYEDWGFWGASGGFCEFDWENTVGRVKLLPLRMPWLLLVVVLLYLVLSLGSFDSLDSQVLYYFLIEASVGRQMPPNNMRRFCGVILINYIKAPVGRQAPR
jgi:hypothetical protein